MRATIAAMDAPGSAAPPPSALAAPPLAVRFGAIGDMIVLTVLLQGLAEIWGRPCDVIASGGAPGRVYRGLACVGEVVTLRSRRTPYWLSRGQRRLVRWLRRRGPSPTWAVERMDKVLWLLEKGGLPPGWVLSRQGLPRGDLEHTVHYLRRMLAERPVDLPAAPGEPAPEPEPVLALSEAERADCRRWIAERGWEGRPLVLFQTQSRRRKRGRWPGERWRAVAAAVLERLPEGRVLLIGSPDEEGELAALARGWAEARVEVAASDLPLRRLFALAAVAHSCVSLDTGPAHVASTLGCPLVVLVGMADPRRNYPWPCGAPVRMVTTVGEADWPATRAEWEAWHEVGEIAVEPVVAAWEQVAALGREAGPGLAYLHGLA